MECICQKRCVIGESPIWNEKDKRLYFVNGFEQEILSLDIKTKDLRVYKVDKSACAISFDKEYRMIVSRWDGAFYLEPDGTEKPLYDTSKYQIQYGNDAKVGPDGRYYIGTQSRKRVGVSDDVDGKLYSIDKDKNVRILLDGLRISNGFDWSIDEKYLYHTDSDTSLVKEYSFDKATGDIEYTGRSVSMIGVDGMTVDNNNNLLVACMHQKHIAVVDTKSFEIKSFIETPAKSPASCAFAGDNMEYLAIVTGTYNVSDDPNAGFTYIHKTGICGRKPYLFG